MSKVIVYIDGFNLYHAIDDLNDNTLKWLNLWALSESFLSPNQNLIAVKYFSAYPTWRPAAYKRHRTYISALESTGVTPILGRFKKKSVLCRADCRQQFITHEEKETDVNIGAHLVADTIRERFDIAFVISADTDILAAVKLAKSESPHNGIHMVAPPGRMQRARAMRHKFEIKPKRLRGYLLPRKIELANGKTILKPDAY